MLEVKGRKIIDSVDILKANVIIGKYQNDLNGIVQRGWLREQEQFRKLPLKDKLARSKRSRANNAYDYIIDEAKDWSSQNMGIAHFQDFNRMQILVIDSSIVIRFKKMDKYGKTGNIITEQVRQFNNQSIPEFDGMVMGNVGYVLNGLNTQIDDILFTVIKGKDVLLHRSIYQGLFDGLLFDQPGSVEYISSKTADQATVEVESLVKIKRGMGEKTKKKNE